MSNSSKIGQSLSGCKPACTQWAVAGERNPWQPTDVGRVGLKLWTTLLLLIVVSACSARGPVIAVSDDGRTYISNLDQTLAASLPRLLAKAAVPSVSVAHIANGQIVALQASGDQSRNNKATIETRYNVASLTKPVTAEVALRLISEGAFTLDESMAPYWVDPDVADDPQHLLLTPRLSLSHQTGFPNWRDPENGLMFERDPGSAPGYSGEGYEYLARFMENRTGTDLEAQAKRLLFDPIGMSETSYTLPLGFEGAIAAARDVNGEWSAPFFRQNGLASDDLVTTAEDYAHFLISLMGNQGLSAPMATQRGEVQADRRIETCKDLPIDLCPQDTGFALGWELLVLNGKHYFMHTGSDDGAFAFAYWSPDDKTGTVILTNSNQGYRVVLPVLEEIGANQEYIRLLHAMTK